MSGPDLLKLLAPELILAIGAMLVLLIGVLRQAWAPRAAAGLSLATILAALIVAWYAAPGGVAAMGLRVDDLAWYVRLIGLSVGLVVLLVNWPLPAPADRGDTYAMILFSLCGILLTAVADDLVLLFLAIELVSVPTYVLVSIGRRDIRAQEAGVKYFFLGAMSAALLVYGFSFLYGASGTTLLSRMSLSDQGGFATMGLVLAFAGLAYKIAAVPMHAYVADVYQGAASSITGLLGFFPKLAGFVALARLIWVLQPAEAVVEGWSLPLPAFTFLWIVAAATMTIGNVLGLMQTNVKRMLAYSSIAHSGYMMIALLVGPITGGAAFRDGLAAMLFYIVAYGIMNLGAFAVLALVESRGRPAEELSDLVGLARRQPAAALALAVCVFSLLGMPPTAGFLGKVFIFTSALSVGPDNPPRMALMALALIGVLNAAVGAAYYLRIIAAAWIWEGDAQTTLARRSGALQIGLVACCIAILLIGLWPGSLMSMARRPFHDAAPPAPLVQR